MSAVLEKSGKVTNEIIVQARGLTKQYGAIQAIKGIDLDIYTGEIFGLIGPDGAGKTSTFHILGGVMEKSGGEISVLNTNPRQARLDTGYLTQQFSLYPDLSVAENINYVGGLREVPSKIIEERKREYLRLLDLDRFADRLAGQLSGGMKQKLALCCALIARPKLLLLDEPTTGVDPVSRREFWDVLASIAAEGVTVAVATPYLDEAERCTRVALMHDGLIHQLGTPQELKSGLGLHRLEIRSGKLAQLEEALSAASIRPSASQIETEAGRQTMAISPLQIPDSRHVLAEDQVPENKDLPSANKFAEDLPSANAQQASPISDLQPFGDRLDLLAANLDSAEAWVQGIADKIGIRDITMEQAEPSLENVFVNDLRQNKDGTEDALAFDEPFPFKRLPLAEKPSGAAIAAEQISKQFGHFQAVKNVSLTVQYGQIFGLLGANGAGKTTTIKMLCGLISASSGKMVLCGEKSNLRSSLLRSRIGYMSQKFTLYDDLTVIENLRYYCGVYGVPEGAREKRINWVLSTCGLSGQENLLTGKLPGGWKQRLAFGASVMHEPEVLFLDEPTSGVDPLARRQLWKLIREFAGKGVAILVTTHFLEEAEHCQNLAFMAAGEIVAQGTPSEIKAAQPGQLVELRTSNNQRASNLLKTKIASWRISIFADHLHLVCTETGKDLQAKELQAIRSLLEADGISILASRAVPYSLEDAFIGIVERAREAA